MSGRLVPFAASAMVFALLPFISASTPDDGARAAVVLAAGDRAAVDTAVDGVQSARDALTGNDSTVAAIAAAALGGGASTTGMAVSNAVGGGLAFPEMGLTPLAALAVAAPVATGVPGFIHPVPGIEVSGFGPRIHPLLHRPMFHTGIDLQAACGTPIRAAASGTVVYARVSNSWGLRTMIQHTPTLKTAYGHQSKFLVKEGDVVRQGQVIGLVGTTGWSTGCHLHFDVIVNDHYVDPAPYLGFPASTSGPSSYGMVPNYFPGGGSVMTTAAQTVPDGDVPFSDVDPASAAGTPAPTKPKPATKPTTNTPAPTTTTGTPVPTTTKPTPSTTTTAPSTSTTTPAPSTTTTTTPPAPSTTTTPPPPPPPTTPPAPATSTPPVDTTTSAAAAPADPTPTPTQTAVATATATATAVAKAVGEIATSAASASDPATTTAAAPAS
ncbi:M23 family metallopeptidase [Intrasporangium sp. YIM S08009]|uniref:M23 family metallopeptidase n=1 Tax=Intrasporangium zincisolvens TaxID=3080018 RepID=UPI002B056582|nr:M23 family metallopeptidase [Intrasporangium sp. YIM S08009]